MNIYPFIAAEKAAAHHVARACALLEVSTSAYYRWSQHIPSARECADRVLGDRIERIHRESRGTYGAPRVHQGLRREGVACGRRRVARLMAMRGLAGRCKRRSKRTTIAGIGRPAATDRLCRAFAPMSRALDRVWVGDITYLRTWEGWCYLSTVIDLTSRRVVGFAMADHMRVSLVCDALRMALAARRPTPGLIFHSDRGSQYTAAEFGRLLAGHGVLQSLSRPRQCWDNAVAESFFATLKTELVYRSAWPTRGAMRGAIFEFIEVFYNRRRLHSALGYCSPAEYEATTFPRARSASAA